MAIPQGFPQLRDLGLSAMIVRFSDRLDEAANRASLALARAIEEAGWEGVEETATALASAFVRFDPLRLPHDALAARLEGLLASRDWAAESLPHGRRLWTIPVALGGAAGPALGEAAELAGLSVAEAKAGILSSRIRVMALGFAPGQPYAGVLPEAWNIPRLSAVTPQVPAGAVVVAIRQLIIFAGPSPTGWRQVGLTGFRPFWPAADEPIRFAPGDELTFREIDADAAVPGPDGLGGATVEVLP